MTYAQTMNYIQTQLLKSRMLDLNKENVLFITSGQYDPLVGKYTKNSPYIIKINTPKQNNTLIIEFKYNVSLLKRMFKSERSLYKDKHPAKTLSLKITSKVLPNHLDCSESSEKSRPNIHSDLMAQSKTFKSADDLVHYLLRELAINNQLYFNGTLSQS